MQSHNPALGAVFAIAAGALFAAMGGAIKLAAATLPNEAIVFLRNGFGLLVLLPLTMSRGAGGIRTSVPWLHLLRAVSGLTAMYCFFYALGRLPLADAMLLNYAMPVFIPWIAWAWLGERPGWPIHVATALGLVGIACIVQPTGALVSVDGLIGASAAVFAAVAMVTVRRLSVSEPAPRIVFYFAAFALTISAIPALLTWQPLRAIDWLLMAGVGLAATAGQLCLTRAYALAPAAQIGTLVYCSVPLSAILGWLFWDEAGDTGTVIGAVCVIAASAIALQRRARA